MTKDYSKTDNWNRNVRTIAEHSKKFPMTRKVDTYEYESLEKMILDDTIIYSEILELFTDKIELARTVYAEAFEEGDKDRVLKAQEMLNDAQIDLKNVTAAKNNYQEVQEQI